jgi:hypothetical protein
MKRPAKASGAQKNASHRNIRYAKNAPVAQLDRASGFEPEGWEFKSLRARHFSGQKYGFVEFRAHGWVRATPVQSFGLVGHATFSTNSMFFESGAGCRPSGYTCGAGRRLWRIARKWACVNYGIWL